MEMSFIPPRSLSSNSTPLVSLPLYTAADVINPSSRSDRVYIAAAICLPILLSFVSLRAYAKLRILRARTWDDYTCIIATLCTIVCILLNILIVIQCGDDHRLWDATLQVSTNEPLLKVTIIYWALYGPFVFFIKLSLLLLYLQIFDCLLWLKCLVWIGIVVTGLFYFSGMIAVLAMCVPQHGESYLESLASPKCGGTKVLSLVIGAFNIISDLYLLIIPLPAIWSLQLPLRKKVGVVMVFMTGLLAFICSVLSLLYRIELNKAINKSWNLIPLHIVTSVEMTAGIVVLCMPAVAAILRHHQGLIRRLLTQFKLKSVSSSSSTEKPDRAGSTEHVRLCRADVERQRRSASHDMDFLDDRV